MRLQILSLVSLGILANVAVAQDETTALRFSQTYMKGSARFTAMGGAFGALGGDVSSFMVNPAGIGVYRTSEFVFSTGFFNANLSSKYSNEGFSRTDNSFDSRNALNIGNAGVVVPIYSNSETAMRFMNFGVAYNRINDYGMNSSVYGYDRSNSITDFFALNTNGIYQNYLNSEDAFDLWIHDEPEDYNFWVGKHVPTSSVLAWDTHLIDPNIDDDDNYMYHSVLDADDRVNQSQWKEVRGFNDVVNITVGGNIFDLVYFGSSLNINNVNYKSTTTYEENAAIGNNSGLSRMTYEESYRAYGTGYSLSLGVILKPIQELRFGLSYQSPTWNFIDEESSSYMYSFVNSNFYESASPVYGYDYRVHSPQKLTASIAGVIGNFAILSADFDWVNYNGMKMKGDRSDRAYFSEINGIIEDTYRNACNFRGGAEFKFGPMALRGGYQYYESPYKHSNYMASDFNYNVQYSTKAPTRIVSVGFGYRDRDCFVDFAYSYMASKNNYSLYNYMDTIDDQDVFRTSGIVNDKIRRNSYILTIGIKM